ncbi:MAG TPA: hypothetical protein VMF53_14885 [Alphaproteobacteria bacterium]|nr:hypothetical protein [Alphaproteobacteria bacterium]
MRFSISTRVGAIMALALSAGIGALAAPGPAWAHAVCGDRVFPATLTMDDPGVGDELSLPTITYSPIRANNGNPSGHSLDYGAEWDKTITKDLGFALNGDYFTQRGAGQNLNGWNNITLTLKDELPCWEAHEFMASIGVIREFAKSGSAELVTAGAIDKVSNTTPTLYLGKGLGDLPIGYLRPLALTGEVGFQESDNPNTSPDQWNYAFSVQYSMPYLDQHVRALGGAAFLAHFVPLVEFVYSAPHNAATTGTISPGVLYEADVWQFGVEAMLPANAATSQTQGVGVIAQFHLFIDDIFPTTLGKPLIDKDLWEW